MKQTEINKLIELSLLGGTAAIRENLNIHNCKEFIEYIAKVKNCDIETAKDLISHNHQLMGLMFAVA